MERFVLDHFPARRESWLAKHDRPTAAAVVKVAKSGGGRVGCTDHEILFLGMTRIPSVVDPLLRGSIAEPGARMFAHLPV